MASPPAARLLSGDPQLAQRWWQRMALGALGPACSCRVMLVLAGTQTAAVPGISAAGSTPEARRRTAAADAELLLLGPEQPLPHALPPLPAGVSPALIARVVLEQLALEPLGLEVELLGYRLLLRESEARQVSVRDPA